MEVYVSLKQLLKRFFTKKKNWHQSTIILACIDYFSYSEGSIKRIFVGVFREYLRHILDVSKEYFNSDYNDNSQLEHKFKLA